MHFTATATAAQAIRVLADSGMNVSAHLVVDRDGSVTQMAPFDYATRHVGASRYNDVTNLNRFSVGIELVNRGQLSRRGDTWVDWSGAAVSAAEVAVLPTPGSERPAGWHTFTEAQVRRTEELIRILRAAYPSITDVLPHHQVSPGRKMDPGPAFPIERVRRSTAPARR